MESIKSDSLNVAVKTMPTTGLAGEVIVQKGKQCTTMATARDVMEDDKAKLIDTLSPVSAICNYNHSMAIQDDSLI